MTARRSRGVSMSKTKKKSKVPMRKKAIKAFTDLQKRARARAASRVARERAARHAQKDRTAWGYASSEESDEWPGASDREQAEDSARDLVESGESTEGWILEGQYPDPIEILPDVGRLIENMEEAAADLGCPDFIDEPIDLKAGAKDALTKLLAAWAKKYVKPNFWMPAGKPILIAKKAEEEAPAPTQPASDQMASAAEESRRETLPSPSSPSSTAVEAPSDQGLRRSPLNGTPYAVVEALPPTAPSDAHDQMLDHLDDDEDGPFTVTDGEP